MEFKLKDRGPPPYQQLYIGERKARPWLSSIPFKQLTPNTASMIERDFSEEKIKGVWVRLRCRPDDFPLGFL